MKTKGIEDTPLVRTKLFSATVVAILVVATGLSTAYAQQESTIRVSNLDQPADRFISVPGNQQWAQSFCTGSVATTLTKVRMFTAFHDWTLNDAPATGTSALPVVTIRADDSGIPGTVLHTLSNPAFDTDLDVAEDFTSDGYALSASTRYWLAVERPASNSLIRFFVSVTPSTEEDSETEPGWAIGDRALVNDDGRWRERWPVSMRMAVYAKGDAPDSTSPVSRGPDCDEAVYPFRLAAD